MSNAAKICPRCKERSRSFKTHQHRRRYFAYCRECSTKQAGIWRANHPKAAGPSLRALRALAESYRPK